MTLDTGCLWHRSLSYNDGVYSIWRIDLNTRGLPGQPDVFIPSLRLVLFADGCFYHGCPRHGHQPKSNRKYWLPKLARNQKRDLANRKTLRAMGCRVWAFWEHELRGKELEKTRKKIIRRIAELVKKKRLWTATPPLKFVRPQSYHQVCPWNCSRKTEGSWTMPYLNS